MVGAIATVATAVWAVWVVIGAFIRKPRIRLSFYKSDGAKGRKILGCEIFNDPVYFGPLVWLGIKRQGFDEVWCLVSVVSATTGEVMLDSCPAALHDRQGGHFDAAPLPAQPWPLYFPVAAMETGSVGIAYDAVAGSGIVLSPDTYKCLFFIHADEIHVKGYGHDFVVGMGGDRFEWVGHPYRLRKPLLHRLSDKLFLRQRLRSN